MKQILILLLLFISSFITAQTIITNTIMVVNDPTSIIYRTDTFYIKSDIIVWYSDVGPIIYDIVSYTKISDDFYTIFCNTNGKIITFMVNFHEKYIKVGNNLLFYNYTRL